MFIKLTQVLNGSTTVEISIRPQDVRAIEPIVNGNPAVLNRRANDAQTHVYTGLPGRTALTVVQSAEEIERMVREAELNEPKAIHFPPIMDEVPAGGPALSAVGTDDFVQFNPQEARKCNRVLQSEGKPYPRTCVRCLLGACEVATKRGYSSSVPLT